MIGAIILAFFAGAVCGVVGVLALVQANRDSRKLDMELDDWSLMDAEWRELSERCYREGRL